MNYALVRLLINFLFDAITALILLDVIGSWLVTLRIHLPEWGYNALRIVRNLADIFLGPIRRLIPSIGGLDISPIIALILLSLLRGLIRGLLR